MKNQPNDTIQDRLVMIQSGTSFGEQDPYSPDCYYPYRLIGILCPVTGEIVVEDLSVIPRKTFTTDVMSVHIEGVD